MTFSWMPVSTFSTSELTSSIAPGLNHVRQVSYRLRTVCGYRSFDSGRRNSFSNSKFTHASGSRLQEATFPAYPQFCFWRSQPSLKTLQFVTESIFELILNMFQDRAGYDRMYQERELRSGSYLQPTHVSDSNYSYTQFWKLMSASGIPKPPEQEEVRGTESNGSMIWIPPCCSVIESTIVVIMCNHHRGWNRQVHCNGKNLVFVLSLTSICNLVWHGLWLKVLALTTSSILLDSSLAQLA